MTSTRVANPILCELRAMHPQNEQKQLYQSIHKQFRLAEAVSKFKVTVCAYSTMKTLSKKNEKVYS